jgi:hypothetical protein
MTFGLLVSPAFSQEKRKASYDDYNISTIPEVNPTDIQVAQENLSLRFQMPDMLCGASRRVDLSFQNPFPFAINISDFSASCGCIRGFVPIGSFDTKENVPVKLFLEIPKVGAATKRGSH